MERRLPSPGTSLGTHVSGRTLEGPFLRKLAGSRGKTSDASGDPTVTREQDHDETDRRSSTGDLKPRRQRNVASKILWGK